jgi:hypothetical protein
VKVVGVEVFTNINMVMVMERVMGADIVMVVDVYVVVYI